MSRLILSSCLAVLLSGLFLEQAPHADAGTIISVVFGGTGSDSSGTKTFSGMFDYDQSQAAKAPYDFVFGSTKEHRVSYEIPAGSTPKVAANSDCSLFEIKTLLNNYTTFHLEAKSAAAGDVTVILNTRYNFKPYPTALPSTCTPFTTNCLPTSQFTVVGPGTYSFTGTITWTTCMTSVTVTGLPPCPPVQACAAPLPCCRSVPRCHPRKRCLFTRLFGRGQRRSLCI